MKSLCSLLFLFALTQTLCSCGTPKGGIERMPKSEVEQYYDEKLESPPLQ